MTDPRLYLDAPLANGAIVPADEAQAHYLQHVLRRRPGEGLILFNARDGEWRGRIESATKKSLAILVEAQLRAPRQSPDLWLVFAPLRQGRLDMVIEKATELGARVLQPVLTDRCQVHKLNGERLMQQAIEAAEQTERLDLPEIREPQRLTALLKSWPADRPLYACCEAGPAVPIGAALADARGPAAVLTGPEGGFSADELALLAAHPAVRPVSLGPRILRAETAVIAALSVWQSACGDWADARPARDG